MLEPTGTPTIQQDAPQEIIKVNNVEEGTNKGELQVENNYWRAQHASGAFGPGADRGCLRQGAALGRVGEDAVRREGSPSVKVPLIILLVFFLFARIAKEASACKFTFNLHNILLLQIDTTRFST